MRKNRALGLELKALKKFGGDKWNRARASLEAQIASLQKSVNDAGSKSKKS